MRQLLAKHEKLLPMFEEEMGKIEEEIKRKYFKEKIDWLEVKSFQPYLRPIL